MADENISGGAGVHTGPGSEGTAPDTGSPTDAPAGIKISVENNTVVKIEGADKEIVGQVSSELRAVRPPEPYKGKGVRYQGEQVRRKAGKTGAK